MHRDGAEPWAATFEDPINRPHLLRRGRFAVFPHHTKVPRAVAVGDWNERLLICKEVHVSGRRRQGERFLIAAVVLPCRLVLAFSMQSLGSNS